MQECMALTAGKMAQDYWVRFPEYSIGNLGADVVEDIIEAAVSSGACMRNDNSGDQENGGRVSISGPPDGIRNSDPGQPTQYSFFCNI